MQIKRNNKDCSKINIIYFLDMWNKFKEKSIYCVDTPLTNT
jgi:hypothetical protein